MRNRVYYITVPKNDEGNVEYDCGIEDSDNLMHFDIEAKEFVAFIGKTFFNDMCEKLRLAIDYGESEKIVYSKIKDVLAYYKDSKDTPNIILALNNALLYKQPVYLDF